MSNERVELQRKKRVRYELGKVWEKEGEIRTCGGLLGRARGPQKCHREANFSVVGLTCTLRLQAYNNEENRIRLEGAS